jgi:hypothetical protein
MEIKKNILDEAMPPESKPMRIILKIKAIFCQVIREGSASDVRRFYYWFKNHLESPLYPVLKGPFENHVAQSVRIFIENKMSIWTYKSYIVVR